MCGPNPAWIGGTQPSATSNDIGWVTGELATYQNWGSGEPNGLNEAGLEFRTNGLWNDFLVASSLGCYVCERAMNVTCDDKNACTVSDVCSGGKCQGGPSVECSGKCKTSATCNSASGCPVLTAATHESKSPAFCDATQSLICTAGTCATAKDTACSAKMCGFNTKTSDCGKCGGGTVCVGSGTSIAVCGIASNFTKTGTTLLPGGAYAMGCVIGDSGCDTVEKPNHVVHLAPFFIDNTEVLYSDYKKCVDTKANAACTALGLSPEPATGMPVYKLSHDQAIGYCKSKNGNLPSEAQWEFAARYNGVTGLVVTTIYPWGNQWPPPASAIPGNFNNSDFTDGHTGMAPSAATVGIDVVAGTSIVNMLGNLREWCLDPHYTSYSENAVNNPVAANTAYDGRVVRGGSYKSTYSSKWQGRLSQRAYLNYPVGATDDTVGVRCVYTFNN